MLFSGCAFFSPATNALAFVSPYVLVRVASHCASVGRESMEFPSSLTDPNNSGTFFEISGPTS